MKKLIFIALLLTTSLLSDAITSFTVAKSNAKLVVTLNGNFNKGYIPWIGIDADNNPKTGYQYGFEYLLYNNTLVKWNGSKHQHLAKSTNTITSNKVTLEIPSKLISLKNTIQIYTGGQGASGKYLVKQHKRILLGNTSSGNDNITPTPTPTPAKSNITSIKLSKDGSSTTITLEGSFRENYKPWIGLDTDNNKNTGYQRGYEYILFPNGVMTHWNGSKLGIVSEASIENKRDKIIITLPTELITMATTTRVSAGGQDGNKWISRFLKKVTVESSAANENGNTSNGNDNITPPAKDTTPPQNNSNQSKTQFINILDKEEDWKISKSHPKHNFWKYGTGLVYDGYLKLDSRHKYSSYTPFNEKNKIEADTVYTIAWDQYSIDKCGAAVSANLDWDEGSDRFFKNSKPNTWETKYSTIATGKNPPSQNLKRIIFNWNNFGGYTNEIKIKNIKIYKGLPNTKFSNGTKKEHSKGVTHIDKYGTFKKNGKSIFPFVFYASSNVWGTVENGTYLSYGRKPKDYLNRGIDYIIGGRGYYDNQQNIYTLEGSYNNGLGNLINLESFIRNVSSQGDIGNRSSALNRWLDIKKYKYDIWSNVLGFYIDNEFHNKPAKYKKAITLIKKYFPEKPIIMLNGHYGDASFYNGNIDYTGTYVEIDSDAISGKEARPMTQHLLAVQQDTSLTTPSGLIEINDGVGKAFGSILISAIGFGGTSLHYWSDYAKNGGHDPHWSNRKMDISKKPWWNELPILKKYANKIAELGILDRGPFVPFKIGDLNAKRWFTLWGRMDSNDNAYIFAANMVPSNSNKSKSWNVGYSGLPYTASGKLVDIVSGKQKGSIVNGKIKLTLKAHEWAVLRVEK